MRRTQYDRLSQQQLGLILVINMHLHTWEDSMKSTYGTVLAGTVVEW